MCVSVNEIARVVECSDNNEYVNIVTKDGKIHTINETYSDFLTKLRQVEGCEQMAGVWIRIAPAGIYECSACGQTIMPSDIDSYKWCHGCGAKMKGKTGYERNEVMNLD